MDKLQRAGRDFLMRLVTEHGLAGAARVLRALASEVETLCHTGAVDGSHISMPTYTPAQLEKYFAEERAKFTDEAFFSSSSARARALRDVWWRRGLGAGTPSASARAVWRLIQELRTERMTFISMHEGSVSRSSRRKWEYPGRRRGDEYRQEPRPDPNANPDLGTSDAPNWIANALRAKVRKRYSHAKELNVLLYLNIPARQVQFDAVRSACPDNLSSSILSGR